MLNFNTNLYPRPYFNECVGYYSIQDKTAELQPVTYCGGSFDKLKDSLKKANLYTGAMRKRIKTVQDKVDELMTSKERIYYVFHQSNNVMTKPAIIICLQSQSGEKRVICSSVKAVIEAGHHAFGDRCDFYVGEWSNEINKNGKSYVWVNMSTRISEKPVSYRGKPAAVTAQPAVAVAVSIDELMQDYYVSEDNDTEAPAQDLAWTYEEPETGLVEVSHQVYPFSKSLSQYIKEQEMQQETEPMYKPDPVIQAMLAGMKKTNVYLGPTDEERKAQDIENQKVVNFYACEHDYYQRQRYAA
jgi:hypothetical protein